MSSTAYRLLGIVVWRAMKWYLRELLPSPRRIVLSLALALVAFGAFAVAAGLLRRAAGQERQGARGRPLLVLP
jgi:uncharacterized protein involved in exopolysaccharide biosynthesis